MGETVISDRTDLVLVVSLAVRVLEGDVRVHLRFQVHDFLVRVAIAVFYGDGDVVSLKVGDGDGESYRLVDRVLLLVGREDDPLDARLPVPLLDCNGSRLADVVSFTVVGIDGHGEGPRGSIGVRGRVVVVRVSHRHSRSVTPVVPYGDLVLRVGVLDLERTDRPSLVVVCLVVAQEHQLGRYVLLGHADYHREVRSHAQLIVLHCHVDGVGTFGIVRVIELPVLPRRDRILARVCQDGIVVEVNCERYRVAVRVARAHVERGVDADVDRVGLPHEQHRTRRYVATRNGDHCVGRHVVSSLILDPHGDVVLSLSCPFLGDHRGHHLSGVVRGLCVDGVGAISPVPSELQVLKIRIGRDRHAFGGVVNKAEYLLHNRCLRRPVHHDCVRVRAGCHIVLALLRTCVVIGRDSHLICARDAP